ncbi:MAG: AI-2E family transporter [Anaerolineales bacterium]|nr:AI-2E family transporter [Anaerolineales bacterium]
MSTHLRSPNWSTPTKLFVAAFATILLGLAVWRFQSIISPLVVAGIMAYILNPLIVLLDRRTPMSRAGAIAIVYTTFALTVMALLTVASVTIYQQTAGLINVIQEIIVNGPSQFETFLSRSITIGPWTFQPDQFEIDFNTLLEQLAAGFQAVLSQSAQFVTAAASMTAGWVGWAVLVFVLSIYFAIDWPRFGGLISDAIYQPGYRQDVKRLLAETGRIWNSYLRGQTLLATLMAVIFSIVLWILGVRYAFLLGVLAGILDFIPFVGAFITVALSTAVAMFQGENWLGLSPLWFGLLVLGIGIILQQIEGNWLNPRIVGGALGLHPLLVMVGAIMGSTLAGLLGVMLAAPVLATVKLLGVYAWRKMFDLDPFPDSETASEPVVTPPAPLPAEPIPPESQRPLPDA